MLKNQLKDQLKKELEELGERVGDRIGKGLSKGTDKKAAQIGQNVGKTLGKQVERVHDAMEKVTVTKEEELGIGGKVGTGLGIIGKHLVEKRYGLLGRLMGSADIISDGRTTGAKAEKMVKSAVKTGLERLAAAKRAASKKGNERNNV
ncbi:MAG: hypothetical protein JW883_07670 [Deltaproteobacteria bacterium]|nr:hypothetical protein [Deltaproteobacteria bacterium]